MLYYGFFPLLEVNQSSSSIYWNWNATVAYMAAINDPPP